MRFPKPLKAGGTIGLVAPARWPEPEWIKKSTQLLEKLGYQVFVHPQCRLRYGSLGGKDEARAEAVMDLFTEPAIDAIICARGGTGAMRMVDLLDYSLIKKYPKIFVGFSDITVLLNVLSQKCGFVTYHGPMGWNFAHPHHRRTVGDLFASVGEGPKSRRLDYDNVLVERAGKAEGRLVGGNLTLLQHLIGTPYDWPDQDVVLFIEDVEEPLYSIDRALQHLRLAGKLDRLCGLIVGEMKGLSPKENGWGQGGTNEYGHTLRQIIRNVVPATVPYALNFPCGHGKFLTTLPVGADVSVEFGRKTVTLSWG